MEGEERRAAVIAAIRHGHSSEFIDDAMVDGCDAMRCDDETKGDVTHDGRMPGTFRCGGKI
jgi:hypothetical protein